MTRLASLLLVTSALALGGCAAGKQKLIRVDYDPSGDGY